MKKWIKINSGDLVGKTFKVESFYGFELILVDDAGKRIRIELEDSGLGYGRGGYTEDMQMAAYEA